MRIGDIAKQAGMTVEAVRFYERQGLLPRPLRTEAGYRPRAEVIETLDHLHETQNQLQRLQACATGLREH